MTKNGALNLAIEGLRHIVKEKRRTQYFPDKRAKMEIKLKDFEAAIEILEALKETAVPHKT